MARKTITHPILGKLTRSAGDKWIGKAKMPAWAKQPATSKEQTSEPREEFEVTFWMDDRDEDNPEPTPAQISALVSVIQAESELASKALDAIWREFSGKQPKCAYWWNGDLEAVNRAIGDARLKNGPIIQKEDVWNYCKLSHISVGGQYETAVELCLKAEWEVEHGVGILAEGNTVIGVGYQTDVSPYDGLKKPDPKKQKDIVIKNKIRSLKSDLKKYTTELSSDKPWSAGLWKPLFDRDTELLGKIKELDKNGIATINQDDYDALLDFVTMNTLDGHLESIERRKASWMSYSARGLFTPELVEKNLKICDRLAAFVHQMSRKSPNKLILIAVPDYADIVANLDKTE